MAEVAAMGGIHWLVFFATAGNGAATTAAVTASATDNVPFCAKLNTHINQQPASQPASQQFIYPTAATRTTTMAMTGVRWYTKVKWNETNVCTLYGQPALLVYPKNYEWQCCVVG